MIVMRSGARQRLRCSSLTKKKIAQGLTSFCAKSPCMEIAFMQSKAASGCETAGEVPPLLSQWLANVNHGRKRVP